VPKLVMRCGDGLNHDISDVMSPWSAVVGEAVSLSPPPPALSDPTPCSRQKLYTRETEGVGWPRTILRRRHAWLCRAGGSMCRTFT
jgi:hypothetical protein